LGVPDKFIEHGTLQELYHECGFDVDSIAQTIKKYANKKTAEKVTSKL
jgi:1-deoxy-D-xylulose-5-phosphate synthase